MKKIFLYLLVLSYFEAKAQDSVRNTVFSGYVEVFYAYEFNEPNNNKRPSFLYSHNRHNEVNINLAFLKAAYSEKNLRANLALATGTYMADNYANESSVFKNMLEANIGWRFGKKIWLDAGVLPSHIGFESAVSKDCWTLTRSLMAENSPYFESGVKLSFQSNDKWTASFLVLNGWQRIERINNTPSVGSQVVWKPTDKVTVNWSTFYGNDRPDSTKQMRFFNNFYGIFQINKAFGIIAGFDLGSEQASKGSSEYQFWYSPNIIARIQLNEKWTLAGRFENYTDLEGVIITKDFRVNAYSINLDFAPLSNALLRVETRLLDSKNKIFSSNSVLKNNNFYLTTALAISF